jgi:hypothetical protein
MLRRWKEFFAAWRLYGYKTARYNRTFTALAAQPGVKRITVNFHKGTEY